MPAKNTQADANKLRIDKWLWAARFFKTRALAIAAIESGKVEINEVRVKPAKSIDVSDRVAIRLGPYQFVVEVWPCRIKEVQLRRHRNFTKKRMKALNAVKPWPLNAKHKRKLSRAEKGGQPKKTGVISSDLRVVPGINQLAFYFTQKQGDFFPVMV